MVQIVSYCICVLAHIYINVQVIFPPLCWFFEGKKKRRRPIYSLPPPGKMERESCVVVVEGRPRASSNLAADISDQPLVPKIQMCCWCIFCFLYVFGGFCLKCTLLSCSKWSVPFNNCRWTIMEMHLARRAEIYLMCSSKQIKHKEATLNVFKDLSAGVRERNSFWRGSGISKIPVCFLFRHHQSRDCKS